MDRFSRMLWLSVAIFCTLTVLGCATAPFNPGSIHDVRFVKHAQSKSDEDIRVSVAVLGAQESKELFGVDLADNGIQPVWLKVENHDDVPYWFLLPGLDPEYFSPMSPLYVYGRKQDVAIQRARSTIHMRNHLRIWLSPMRFQGKPVWVGQISRDIGVRFTSKSSTLTTHKIDPDVDEARNGLVSDLIYSQALVRFGFVKGVGKAPRNEPRQNLTGDPYYTDGLRVVLWFEDRPLSLTEVEFIDWVRPRTLEQLR